MDGVLILVVEDEFLIRLDALHLLEAAGFAAIEATNTDEPISILESGTTFVSSSPTSRCPAPWMD